MMFKEMLIARFLILVGRPQAATYVIPRRFKVPHDFVFPHHNNNASKRYDTIRSRLREGQINFSDSRQNEYANRAGLSALRTYLQP